MTLDLFLILICNPVLEGFMPLLSQYSTRGTLQINVWLLMVVFCVQTYGCAGGNCCSGGGLGPAPAAVAVSELFASQSFL